MLAVQSRDVGRQVAALFTHVLQLVPRLTQLQDDSRLAHALPAVQTVVPPPHERLRRPARQPARRGAAEAAPRDDDREGGCAATGRAQQDARRTQHRGRQQVRLAIDRVK